MMVKLKLEKLANTIYILVLHMAVVFWLMLLGL